MSSSLPELTPEDRSHYEWQMWCAGVGEAGQRKLKGASVLVSRCGGVGGAVALQLAAAGVGHLVVAHAGNLRIDDLNRQILMSHAGIGTPRIEQVKERLLAVSPGITVEAVPENLSSANAEALVGSVDIVASCAPLFEERFAMNAACVRQRKPMIDAAMYDFDIQLMTLWPGQGPCLNCVYPEAPASWKRQFPVFGAVASVVGSLAAAEIIKVITGIEKPLDGLLLSGDLRHMEFRKVRVRRDPKCLRCGGG